MTTVVLWPNLPQSFPPRLHQSYQLANNRSQSYYNQLFGVNIYLGHQSLKPGSQEFKILLSLVVANNVGWPIIIISSSQESIFTMAPCVAMFQLSGKFLLKRFLTMSSHIKSSFKAKSLRKIKHKNVLKQTLKRESSNI